MNFELGELNNVEGFDDGIQYFFTITCVSDEYRKMGISFELEQGDYKDNCWQAMLLLDENNEIKCNYLWYINDDGDIHEVSILEEDLTKMALNYIIKEEENIKKKWFNVFKQINQIQNIKS